ADRIEAQLLGFLGHFDHFANHPLPALGMIGDRPQLAALVKRRGKGGQKEVHEFHSAYLDRRLCSGWIPILRFSSGQAGWSSPSPFAYGRPFPPVGKARATIAWSILRTQ